MAVYVDDMRAKFGRMVMCHMIADTDNELRAMADRIGVQQKWHQGDHFDICLKKRAQAVTGGAIEVTQRQLGAMVIRKRRTGEPGKPEDAVEWLRQTMRKPTNAPHEGADAALSRTLPLDAVVGHGR